MSSCCKHIFHFEIVAMMMGGKQQNCWFRVYGVEAEQQSCWFRQWAMGYWQ